VKFLNDRKPFEVVILSVLLLLASSCELIEEEEQFSDLEVIVNGSLSGVPREGVSVNVYLTELDAKNEVNPITFSDDTDSNGIVLFPNLDPGSSYWIRANTLLLFSIKQTRQLKVGFNEFEITVL
jgi:hypothetical protein